MVFENFVPLQEFGSQKIFGQSHKHIKSRDNFLYKVYGWMAVGLGITTITSYAIASSPWVYWLLAHSWLFFLLFLLQLGLVVYLTYALPRMSTGLALAAFIGYSFVTGITFSTLFLVYTLNSLASTFGVAAGMFGCMALYGYLTKTDLSRVGNILFMALIGLIIGSIINLFTHSSQFNLIISGFGVIIFTGLTAYDVQKIKNLARQFEYKSPTTLAIFGALTLYLDFINLFLSLLSFTGKRRD